MVKRENTDTTQHVGYYWVLTTVQVTHTHRVK